MARWDTILALDPLAADAARYWQRLAAFDALEILLVHIAVSRNARRLAKQ
jgi:hypothetical protein